MKDLKHYLLLMTILSFGLGFFWLFNFDRQAQMIITAVMGMVYVLWGIGHHSIKKDLHWRIILEYGIVAILASTVVIFLLLRT